MIKEQFDILRKCVEQGYAKNIEVHYNTNCTQFPEKELNDISVEAENNIIKVAKKNKLNTST